MANMHASGTASISVLVKAYRLVTKYTIGRQITAVIVILFLHSFVLDSASIGRGIVLVFPEVFETELWSNSFWLQLTFTVIWAIGVIFILSITLLAIYLPISHFVDLFRKVIRKNISINDLFFSYIEIIILFATIYYLISFYFPANGISKINIVKDFNFYGGWRNEYKALLDIVSSFIDCLHFSVVTQTTLGYGDMLPLSVLTKILVDAQVLIGIYFIVVAIGLRLSREAPKP